MRDYGFLASGMPSNQRIEGSLRDASGIESMLYKGLRISFRAGISSHESPHCRPIGYCSVKWPETERPLPRKSNGAFFVASETMKVHDLLPEKANSLKTLLFLFLFVPVLFCVSLFQKNVVILYPAFKSISSSFCCCPWQTDRQASQPRVYKQTDRHAVDTIIHNVDDNGRMGNWITEWLVGQLLSDRQRG